MGVSTDDSLINLSPRARVINSSILLCATTLATLTTPQHCIKVDASCFCRSRDHHSPLFFAAHQLGVRSALDLGNLDRTGLLLLTAG